MQIDLNRNVSDIAANSLEAVRLFEHYGIDYCCGGKRPLADVCREKGLDPAAVAADLGTEGQPDPADVNWTTAGLTDLIRHIVTRHHGYLKSELPLLAQRLTKVVQVYGETEGLAGLKDVFTALRAELELHLHKEEVILFPYVERLVAGGPAVAPCGWIGQPIAVMEHEHEDAGEALRRIRAITRNFEVPEGACITYRSLLAGLEELEHDLHMHIHLENNILFPRAMALEKESSRAVL
jgi:regulator of cell morphogenesis and NO signaling